jgi:Sec-independent protein secretion pathway component TatC
MAPSLIMVRGVSLPGALRAPSDPFSTSLVPAPVALLWEVAVLFHEVVAAAGVAGAELAEISALRGRIG